MLHDSPRQHLLTLISRFGRPVCHDTKRCEAILRDWCPEFKRETHLLVAALKEQVVADLLTTPPEYPIHLTIQQLTKRLHDNLGIAENFALWAVESWAFALGLIEPAQLSVQTAPVETSPISASAEQEAGKNSLLNQLGVSLHKLLNLLKKDKLPPVHSASTAKPSPPTFFHDTLKNGKPALRLVRLRGGRFLMGSPSTEIGRYSIERLHEVSLPDFILGQYAVTFADYDAFVKDSGWRKPSDNGWGRGLRPVIDVSWHDALAYAAWLSEQTGQRYRLPTEAEWEYACRAGFSTAFATGHFISTAQANFNGTLDYGDDAVGDYRQQTVDVGSFAANPYGLYDMHGNVWEWTASAYSENYAGHELLAADSTSDNYRMLRGGSWVNTKRSLRSASRIRRDANDRADFIGFRLAREP
jgi:formylglycine-generating enzyme required for sulfatase activity